MNEFKEITDTPDSTQETKPEVSLDIKSEVKIESKSDLPGFIPVVPLRDIVIFPYMMYPILAGRESTISAINYALDREKYVLLLTQRDHKAEEAEVHNLYE